MIPARPSQIAIPHPLIGLTLALAASLLGCSKSPPTGPPAAAPVALSGRTIAAEAGSGFGSATFYPLVVGNLWTYEGGGVGHIVSGGGEPPPWVDLQYAFSESHRLIGMTYHEGTAYVVEEQINQSIPEGENGPWTAWSRLRQDPTGLFALDTLLLEPPPLEGGARLYPASTSQSGPALRIDFGPWVAQGASKASLARFADRVEMLRMFVRGFVDHRGEPASPAGAEVRFLAYPLHVGQSWSNRSDFPWPSRVDGVETLNTPAGRFTAYRIDIVPGGTPLEEGEWVHVWYSRAGYLGYSIRTYAQGTDENGEPTGVTYVFDDSMFVTSVQIAR